LVLLELRTRLAGPVQKEIVGIQEIVTQEFENRAVEIVAARLGNHADIGTYPTTKCCVVETGLNLELFQAVGVRNWDSPAYCARALNIADTNAIELPIVVIRAGSVDVNPVR